MEARASRMQACCDDGHCNSMKNLCASSVLLPALRSKTPVATNFWVKLPMSMPARSRTVKLGRGFRVFFCMRPPS